MSSDPALEVVGLGKRYRIARRRERSTSLAEALLTRLRHPWPERETLWALRDVSFRVERGEVLGILGRNGAGKSTLLKVLSRITPPSEGRAELYGRTGSLLEVGTGFHPELTGRENVFLNGSLLGMRRREIRARFDEIVAFAGVERFLDVPVKRYSSGMYVRLAFAIAAHLDPDVLIVDEVLAVGDAGFQARCIERMRTVADEGRTVLLVSHNLAVVRSLTERAVWLDGGRLSADGPTGEVVDAYLRDVREHTPRGRFAAGPDDPGALRSVEVLADGERRAALPMGAPLGIRVRFEPAGVHAPHVGVGVETEEGRRVASLSTFYDPGAGAPPSAEGEAPGVVECHPLDLHLNRGRYRLTVTLSDGHPDVVVDRREAACTFEVTPRDVFGTGHVPDERQGLVWSRARWRWSRAERGAAREVHA